MLLCQPCFLQYCYCCQGTETQHHCSNIYVIQFCWMKKTNCHNASNVVLPQQQRTWPMQSPATASVVAKRTIVTSGRTLAHTRTHTCTNHQVCVLPVHDLQWTKPKQHWQWQTANPRIFFRSCWHFPNINDMEWCGYQLSVLLSWMCGDRWLELKGSTMI